MDSGSAVYCDWRLFYYVYKNSYFHGNRETQKKIVVLIFLKLLTKKLEGNIIPEKERSNLSETENNYN